MELRDFFDLNIGLTKEVVVKRAARIFKKNIDLVESEYIKWRKDFMKVEYKASSHKGKINYKANIKSLEDFAKYYSEINKSGATEQEAFQIGNLLMKGCSTKDLVDLEKWDRDKILRIYVYMRRINLIEARRKRRGLYE